MCRVAGSAFSWRQNVSPSVPGMLTSSTTTSGTRDAMRSRAKSADVGFLDLDVDDLERRAEQDPQGRVVVDDEQPEPAFAPGGVGHRAQVAGARDGPCLLTVACENLDAVLA